MKLFDLHCDTIERMEEHGENMLTENCQLSLRYLPQVEKWCQTFAIFIPDSKRGADAMEYYERVRAYFHKMLDEHKDIVEFVHNADDIKRITAAKKCAAVLSVEGAAVLGGKLENIEKLARDGVKMMTLTWNFKNGLAEPNIVPGTDDMWPRPANTTGGLTEKGLEFVEEMQRLHMLVDVSHLSDAGIWDILRVAKRPFVASHSNARACCPHVRNLTDEMLTAMGEKGCLIGLNYCASFLDTNPDRSQVRSRITDMARHARYIMDKAGEDCLALGSDFDGIDGDLEIAGAQDMPKLAEGMKKEGIPERVVEKIFYGNAVRFFSENL